MSSDTQHEPEHLTLLHQLRGSSTSVYMTLLSIVQGVTLSDLATVVGNSYTHFTLVHWLLVLATLILIVAVWHQILIDSISLDWVPDIGDAAVPFVIGILELVLNHMIPLSLSFWLFLLAIILFFLEIVGSVVFTRQKAELAADANRKLLHLLRRRHRPYLLHGLSGTALFLLLGLLCLVEGVHATDGAQQMPGLLAVGMGGLAVCWVVSLIFIPKGYWRAVVSYARTGGMSKSEKSWQTNK